MPDPAARCRFFQPGTAPINHVQREVIELFKKLVGAERRPISPYQIRLSDPLRQLARIDIGEAES